MTIRLVVTSERFSPKSFEFHNKAKLEAFVANIVKSGEAGSLIRNEKHGSIVAADFAG